MSNRRTRVEALDPANTCSHCPHALVRLGSGTMWCPCEDCHPGGLIQGRVPKLLRTNVTEGDFTLEHDATGQQVITPVSEPDDEVWVDPIHQV
jgi:hypothetical protein